MTLHDYILLRVARLDAARAAMSDHYSAHRSEGGWHPLGTPERRAADLRSRREYARLRSELVEAETAAAVAIAYSRRLSPRWYWDRVV